MVVRIDRVGRNWLDTVECMLSLRRIGVKITSLDSSESWTSLLELNPSDPMAYAGHMMLSFAAWVAHQERELGRQRTKDGLANARAKGKRLGRPPALNERQTEKAKRMVDSGLLSATELSWDRPVDATIITGPGRPLISLGCSRPK